MEKRNPEEIRFAKLAEKLGESLESVWNMVEAERSQLLTLLLIDEQDGEVNGNIVEEVENNSIKKRRGRGKGVEYVFGNTFKNLLHFTGSTFYQKLTEECSLKTKTSHEHGDVEIFVCKFSRKKAFEECPVKSKVVYPSNSTAVEVFVTDADHIHEKKNVDRDSNHFSWTKQQTEIIKMGSN